jgi:ActD protein
MAGKNTSVFGVYHDRPGVEEAVNVLCAGGFRGADISVLFQENQGTKDFAHVKSTKAPEGAVAGAVLGAIIGAVFAWLVSTGNLTVSGLDVLRTNTPWVAALAGLGSFGILGGIIGASIGLGLPEFEAKRFQGRRRHGGALMSVHCDNHDWAKRAKDILRQTGAEDVAVASEAGADFSVSDKPMQRTRRAIGDPPCGDTPVVVEQVDRRDLP